MISYPNLFHGSGEKGVGCIHPCLIHVAMCKPFLVEHVEILLVKPVTALPNNQTRLINACWTQDVSQLRYLHQADASMCEALHHLQERLRNSRPRQAMFQKKAPGNALHSMQKIGNDPYGIN